MSTLGITPEQDCVPTPRTGWMDGTLRKQVLARLAAIEIGSLVVDEGGRRHEFGGLAEGPAARIVVRSPEFFSAVALRGSVGAGEAFMDGHWEADDLVSVVRLLVRNRAALEELEGGLAKFALPLLRYLHEQRRNHKDGSRRNIAEHYDLGNEFYALWLDGTLTYSAGVFETAAATLLDAQVAKLDRICRKLDLGPDDHVIEIGTGWGSFAIHAALHYGCRVTTTTISRQQRLVAAERVAAAGLTERITLLDADYRDLDGAYDKLVSIEMIEAVGHEYLDTYFAKCAGLLREGGLACIQAITIDDRYHDDALGSVDFIQRYIFPGCYIPSLGSISASVARATDLCIAATEDIGLHYAKTLRLWRERFLAARHDVSAQGFDERFRRMWEFYLAYCEGGFAERQLGDLQIVLAKPGAALPAGPPLAPPAPRP